MVLFFGVHKKCFIELWGFWNFPKEILRRFLQQTYCVRASPDFQNHFFNGTIQFSVVYVLSNPLRCFSHFLIFAWLVLSYLTVCKMFTSECTFLTSSGSSSLLQWSSWSACNIIIFFCIKIIFINKCCVYQFFWIKWNYWNLVSLTSSLLKSSQNAGYSSIAFNFVVRYFLPLYFFRLIVTLEKFIQGSKTQIFSKCTRVIEKRILPYFSPCDVNWHMKVINFTISTQSQ